MPPISLDQREEECWKSIRVWCDSTHWSKSAEMQGGNQVWGQRYLCEFWVKRVVWHAWHSWMSAWKHWTTMGLSPCMVIYFSLVGFGSYDLLWLLLCQVSHVYWVLSIPWLSKRHVAACEPQDVSGWWCEGMKFKGFGISKPRCLLNDLCHAYIFLPARW